MKKMLLGFVLVLATLFTSVWAENNPRAVIIFDASGSMWGQINGVTKIEIARDALKNVVKEWNPSVELGLTVYGHRSKGDCNDIESIIPVGKVDKNRVIRTVMGIKPKGKTPISRSLRKVAEEIKYTEEKATIILISDGKETCDPDPCGTAKELEAQGIDFVTHVIGFNVDKKTSQQLECIADATGGEYFSAKNAAALNEAMKVIAKKVEVVEEKPEPKPKVKKLNHTVEVSASEKEGGKWVAAYNSIYEDEDGKAGEL
ncbi:MAG TPA: VWA domain-containing protein, partial [Sulfurovum sp.]|nr:VWA domain-containing protein [Sulfurovum sp.]